MSRRPTIPRGWQDLTAYGERFGRLLREHRGATAVEFAVILPVFLLIVFSVIDVSIMYLNNLQLESATSAAARAIRTGQVNAQTNTGSDPYVQLRYFRQELCDHILLTSCDRIGFQVVRVGGTFTTATAPADFNWSSFDSSGRWTGFNADGSVNSSNPPSFTLGAASEVMLIRTARQYSFLIPYTAGLWAGWGGTANTLHMVSTVVVRNEPF